MGKYFTTKSLRALSSTKNFLVFLNVLSVSVVTPLLSQNSSTHQPPPKPQTIKIPEKPGGFYYIQTKSGPKKIPLTPPEVIPLAVLKNKKGEPIHPRPAIRTWLDTLTHKVVKVDSLSDSSFVIRHSSFLLGDAGGFSHMQNYNTEQGLALSSLTQGVCRDHFGNLWFGTYGGGVSRYDGKSFTNFTTAQGLANNVVLSIIEDKLGNLWFGTEGGGVSHYNGKTFTNFTNAQGLANNIVYIIMEDKSGNLWFGTEGGGVSRYDGKIFTNFTSKQGLANNVVLSIAEDKSGNLWFGTSGGGVSRYNPKEVGTGKKNFTTFSTAHGLANNVVYSIVNDKSGNLWFGTSGGGVSRYNPEESGICGKTFTTFTTEQGLANNVVYCIVEDKSGNLWFGTSGGGVSRYNSEEVEGHEKIFTTFTTEQGLANNVVYSIVEDKSGNLWFGTNGGGINRYDGKSFTNFTSAQGMANNSIWSIVEDKSENLWFGTYGGGVSRYDGKSLTNFTSTQGLADNNVWSIVEDKSGNIWFGTSGGVSRYNGKSFTNYTSTQRLTSNVVRSIVEDKKGNLWFGTYGGGVSRYDGKSITNFTSAQGLASNVVRSIVEDKKGNLWFGTYGGGVSRYDGKSFTNFTSAQGLANNVVYSIMEDKSGNLWFGTNGGGVSRYDGKTFFNFTTGPHFMDGVITAIAQDKMNITWFGSNFGFGALSFETQNLRFFSEKNKEIPDFLRNKKEGESFLADNPLTNEELGLCKPVWDIYNTSNGYPVKDVNSGHNTMYCDSKGIVWIATGDDKTALVRFDPSQLKKDTLPPKLVIQKIQINNENICWYGLRTSEQVNIRTFEHSNIRTLEHSNEGNSHQLINQSTHQLINDSATLSQQEMMTYGKILTEEERAVIRQKYAGIKFARITPFYPLPDSLVLPYEHKSVTFEYLAIEPAKPYLNQYQYRLEGYHKKGEWSPITSKTDVTFGNLDPGKYTFMVKATTIGATITCQPINSSTYQPVTTEYTFTVSPPYYQSLWFYGMEVAVLLLGVCIVLWFRTRNVVYSVRLSLFIVSVSTFISFEYFQNFIENFLVQNIVLLTTVKLVLNALIGISYIWLEAGFFKIMGLTGAKMQIDKRRLFKKNIFSVEKVAMKGDLLRERKEGKLDVVKNLLKENISDEIICRVAGITQNELEIIKNKIQNEKGNVKL